MSSPATFQDVHVYDGRIRNVKLAYKVDEENKQQLFKFFHNSRLTDDTAKLGVRMIASDTQKPPNYDPSNDKYADDLLAALIIYMLETETTEGKESTESLTRVIEEQLSDFVKLGQCPQGRCTRLLQVYNSISQNIKPSKDPRKELTVFF